MVFVLDKHKKPLMPCSEKRARKLLEKKKAVVHKMEPFTIRIKDRTVEESKLQPLRLKLDPGSKETGIAVINEEFDCGKVIFLGEIHHKKGIKSKLDSRRASRRSRRNRKTRYRKARFLNRKRKKGWLPPSLEARVNQTISTVNRLQKLLPITAISTEHIKFDTQLMQNPEISGIEYQQGELFGYEVKEYLLEKWGRKCAYCGIVNSELQVEHVVPKKPKHGPKGTDRISNLTIACESCNGDKDNLQPQEWLEILKHSSKKLDQTRAVNLQKVLENLEKPLKDAAMVNYPPLRPNGP
jgi:5-methylcytosine-specific restriction endonuclease McrA